MRLFVTSRPTDRATPEALAAEMEAEVAVGRDLYREGVILQAWMDTDYSRTFMIVEAESLEAANARFAAYPHVRAGLIAFEFVPIVGMPAVAQAHEADGRPLPDWWPALSQESHA